MLTLLQTCAFLGTFQQRKEVTDNLQKAKSYLQGKRQTALTLQLCLYGSKTLTMCYLFYCNNLISWMLAQFVQVIHLNHSRVLQDHKLCCFACFKK